jgi:wyosine [tRNA(Phe)-imidazoG37] synthetase (radical SAM superfamily)
MHTGLLPGPPRVQIQTQSGCNGRCVFCPNEDTLKTDMEHGRMAPELFRKIIDDLARTPPRRIMLYLQNEPLADKRMPEFVEYVARKIPSTSTLITTNGTYLSEDRAEALIDAGLKRLKVSLQSLKNDVNHAIMGYDADKVVENILGVRQVMKRKRIREKDFDFRVSMVVTKLNEPEIEEARRFWRRHGVRLVTSALENRGGNITQAADLNVGEMRSMGDCIRPSRDMCILFNGDTVLCCVDWFRTVNPGNVAEQSVQEVWNGIRLQQIRQALHEGDVEAMPPICANCTESACPNKHRRGLKGMWARLVGAR